MKDKTNERIKILISIVSLFSIIAIVSLFFGFVHYMKKTQISYHQFLPTPSPFYPTAVPAEKTALLSLKQISPTEVAVVVNTGNQPISGVELQLSYDPRVLQEVSVTPESFFDNPLILENKINTDGTILFISDVGLSGTPKTGTGTLATITFTPNPGIVNQTTIDFLPKTSVVYEGAQESILKDAKGITIPL